LFTLAPFKYAVKRALGRRSQLHEVAARTWVIEPESTQVVPKATFIESALSRVTAPAPFSTLQSQYEIIGGGEVTHLPVRALSLKNAALVGASVYAGGYRMPLAPKRGFAVADLLRPAHLGQAALGSTYFGNMFFGHFWTDDVPLMQLGQELAEPVRTARPLTGHQRELVDLLGLRPRLSGSLTFDELIVFEDAGQGKGKERRYRAIRDAFAREFSRPDPPRGVFLFRGAWGSARHLVHEEEIAAALLREGIVSVHPEQLSLSELARRLWGTRLVVGVEGSQLLHGPYTMAEGGSILALMPPMRFGNIIKNYTDCLGMKYGFVVGEPCDEGFEVKLDEVLRTIEMLEAQGP
jgi:hypothetical protein